MPVPRLRHAAVWLQEHVLPWAVFLGVWQGLALLFPVPSAARVLSLAAADTLDPRISSALAGSLSRMTIGFAMVVVLGVPLGFVIGRVRLLGNILGTLASALNAMPGAAWVPLAIFIFGLNEKAVIFTIVLGATGIVMQSTSTGVREVPKIILHAARTMGAKDWKIFWHVILPAATPRILDGLRLAWAFGWRALMAGELLISTVHGMGQLISEVSKQRDIEQLLAYMVIIALIGMVVDNLFFNRLLGDRIRRRWGTA